MMSKPLLDRGLSDWLAKPEDECVAALLAALDWDQGRAERVGSAAKRRIEAIRAEGLKGGSLESFFQQYKLSKYGETRERIRN